MTATTTTRFVDGIARYLMAQGIVRYGLPAPPPGPLPAVYLSGLPATPDGAVSIIVYDERFDRDDQNPDVFCQFRWRTAGKDIRTTDDLADAAKAILHDMSHVTLPNGVVVALCRRRIRGLTVPDDNGRYERADSYQFILNPEVEIP